MINFILKKAIKNSDQTDDPIVRKKYGVVSGAVGIITNSLLFIAKIIIGLFTASVSIIADAINNLSDAGSSLVTLIGFKISARPADKEHPYGHARYEYISGLIIVFLVLIIGFELLKSSIEKILNKTPTDFSYISIIILVSAILLKIWQMLFYIKAGKKINSNTLKATAFDSRNDVITTTGVLIATIVSKLIKFNLDGYIGVLVSLFIIVSAFKLIKETIDPLIGTMPDEDLVNKIKDKIKSYDNVKGYHDLIIHNYGPLRCYATVHVEVPSSKPIMESHDMIDNIERDFLKDLNIHLVIHLDPIDVDDEETNTLKAYVQTLIDKMDECISIHDFRLVKGVTHTNVIFDVVMPQDCKMTYRELQNIFDEHLKELGKNYYTVITIDRSYIG